MDILNKLFGSETRVRLLRLFLSNPDIVLEPKEIIRRVKMNAGSVRREISLLSSIGFISQKRGQTFEAIGKRVASKKVKGWQLEPIFPLRDELYQLVGQHVPISDSEVARRFRGGGKIKLLVTSGALINLPGSRADLLIVGDRLKKPYITRAIARLEAELGRELHYATLETADLEYRIGVYDKFVRDILDYPHRKIINKINI